VDPLDSKLGLQCYPDVPSPPTSWRRVEGSTEQACSRVAAVDRLLCEAMVVVSRDILQPVYVSFKEWKGFT
jgi:hypothetical protein